MPHPLQSITGIEVIPQDENVMDTLLFSRHSPQTMVFSTTLAVLLVSTRALVGGNSQRLLEKMGFLIALSGVFCFLRGASGAADGDVDTVVVLFRSEGEESMPSTVVVFLPLVLYQLAWLNPVVSFWCKRNNFFTATGIAAMEVGDGSSTSAGGPC
jgi:hypothetical protein